VVIELKYNITWILAKCQERDLNPLICTFT